MSEIQKDILFELIKSLSKSEKRQFKVYVNRLGINADAKFLLLFSALEKMDEYDEKAILKKKITTKTQLSNLKAHLYRQILISLRMNPNLQNIRVQIREQLDFAEILYNKGLYKQSLKILEKAKRLTLKSEEKTSAYEIIEFEKNIESQYITRSEEGRADTLISQAKTISQQNVITSKLSNMALKLYSSMLKYGYAKDESYKLLIINYFNKNISKLSIDIMGVREQLWLYQAYVWKSLLLQDFESAYEYSSKWVSLFYENPEMIQNNPIWFLKGNNYLLESLFLNRGISEFEFWWNKLKETIKNKQIPENENVKIALFIDVNTNLLNFFFLKGNFSQYKLVEKNILSEIKIFETKIDTHHILILYFKMGALSFINEDYKQTLHFTQKIISHKINDVQEDLLFHSHILSLMAKFESGFDADFEESVASMLRLLQKMQRPTEVQKEVALFFSKIYKLYPNECQKSFEDLLKTLIQIAENPYNRRSLRYLDVIAWAESKVKNIKVKELIIKK
ncbi:MAG: hypothetical protein Q4C98_00425 [Capnocytophaga sp.]|nr:hypothetical protein [Capnocytophaga sp.]